MNAPIRSKFRSARQNPPALPPLKRTIATLLATAAFLHGSSLFAASGTWIGGGSDGLWSTPANWTSSTVAGGIFAIGSASQDTATFNAVTGQMTVGIDAGRNFKFLSFDTGAGSYTIGDAGPGGGEALNLSANGTTGKVHLLSTLSGTGITQTINAPIVLQPSTAGSAISYSFINDSADSSNVLQIAGPISSGTSGTGTITLNGANTGANEISGDIIGTGGGNFQVNKSGPGSWTLSGSVVTKGTAATGGMTVTGGTLNLTGSATITGKVVVKGAADAATVGGTINSSGIISLGTSAGDYITIGDGGAGTLNVTGGTLSITPSTGKAFVIGTSVDATNTATGVINVSHGTLRVTNTAPIRFGNWEDNRTRNGVGILNISGDGLFDTGTTTGAFVLGIGSPTSSGTINLDGGTLQTRRSITEGPAGTGGSGVINFNGGTLKATAANASLIGATVTTNVKAGGATIDTNGFAVGIASALEEDAISTGGGLTKIGAGTLTLNGANTYTGITSVDAGTLALGASGSLSESSEIIIAEGASLDVSASASGLIIGSGNVLRGSGDIAGDVTLAGGAVLAPGNSAGVLDINGDLTFGPGSILSLEINGNAPGEGPGFYDQVNMTAVGGLVSIASTATIQLTLSGFLPSSFDTYFVLNRADAGTYGTNVFGNAPEGATVSLGDGLVGSITYLADSATSSLTGGNDIAIYNVVPEPTTSVMLLGGLGCLLPRRRSRNRS